MQIGLIGLKNSGKSTLFTILTGRHDTEPDRSDLTIQGIFTTFDSRLETLQKLCKSKKQVHPSFEILDLPPIVALKDAVESVSSKILEEVKNCDALIQVVRQFTNPAVPADLTNPDPVTEKSNLDTELVFVDLAIVENRLERIEKMKNKSPDFCQPGEIELLEKCKDTLENENPLSVLDLDASSEKLLRGYQFLTIKPRVTIINIDEEEIPNSSVWIDRLENSFPAQKGAFEAICCRTEQEILELSEEEQVEFRKDLGIEEPASKKVAVILMDTIRLIRFLTVGDPAAQSWIIPEGTAANKAAGTIHTDIERGFIRAELVTYDNFVKYGSIAKCKENGCFRLEGKDYIVKEGDVIMVRFNV